MQVKAASERLEKEMRAEIREEQGIDSKTAMNERLEDFGKCDEFTQMQDAISGMLSRQAEQKQSVQEKTQKRQQKIDDTVE
jgi:predicted hydrocarbon binding protein